MDTINGWTKVGNWIYDWLFPPAIEITTIPSNAQAFIDGKALEGRTPITFDEISPGTHKLELSLEQYKPIVKSLFVPRKGTIRVQGEAINGKSRSYLFRFNTEIEINSVPPGALIYLNDIRFNQKTPCTVSWEVGAPLSIEMERNGFERLMGYSLNTINGYDEVEDRRVWDTKVIKEPYMKYAINGTFRKRIIIESLPQGAEIYTIENNNAIGVTGKNNSVLLTAGTHELILKKDSFIPKKLKLKIDENSNDKVFAILSRKVYFTAIDELDLSSKDIGALLVSLDNGRKNILNSSKITPFEMVLPAFPYSAVFQKDGYRPSKVEISAESQIVRAEMKSANALVIVKVLDAVSLTPIQSAKISYNFVGSPQIKSALFQHTDAEGEGSKEIAEGNYIFSVEKAGYISSNKNLSARAGNTYNLLFKIYPANQ
ncbi:MAG: PEGA domain-containing protein [bacterium]